MVVQLGLTVLGMTELLGTLGAWFEWIRWIGVAYLIYLGIAQWRAPPLNLAEVAPEPKSARAMFTRALLVSLTNPKTLFFYGAFFPQFVVTSHRCRRAGRRSCRRPSCCWPSCSTAAGRWPPDARGGSSPCVGGSEQDFRRPARRRGRRPRAGPQELTSRTSSPRSAVQAPLVLRHVIEIEQLGEGVDQPLRHRPRQASTPTWRPLMLRTGQMQSEVEVRNASSAV